MFLKTHDFWIFYQLTNNASNKTYNITYVVVGKVPWKYEWLQQIGGFRFYSKWYAASILLWHVMIYISPKTMKATFLVASYPFILMEGVIMLQQYFCTMNCFKTLGGLFFYQMQYILGLTYLFSDMFTNSKLKTKVKRLM